VPVRECTPLCPVVDLSWGEIEEVGRRTAPTAMMARASRPVKRRLRRVLLSNRELLLRGLPRRKVSDRL